MKPKLKIRVSTRHVCSVALCGGVSLFAYFIKQEKTPENAEMSRKEAAVGLMTVMCCKMRKWIKGNEIH